MSESEKGASLKARPILFSAPMVRALLEGQKTQTRRSVNPRKYGCDLIYLPDWDEDYRQYFAGDRSDPGCWGWPNIIEFDPLTLTEAAKWGDNPYGKPGDLLWVRESFSHCAPDEWRGSGRPWYWADGQPSDGDYSRPRPSIHMPRWASRLTLELTEAQAQRLQDISEQDAKAEGLSVITKDDGRTWKYGIPDRDGLPGNDDDGWHWPDWNVDPRVAYARLWQSINGPGSWDVNPWVWALTFRVHQQNIDPFLAERRPA